MIPFNSFAGGDSELRNSVSSVIPVMSIKLGWLTGRVWDGAGGDWPKAMGSVGPGGR